MEKKLKFRADNAAAATVCVDDDARITHLFVTKFSLVNGGGKSISGDNLVTTQTHFFQRFLAKKIRHSVENLEDSCGQDGLHTKFLEILEFNNLWLLSFLKDCIILSYIPQ